jgi:hypothetical protein
MFMYACKSKVLIRIKASSRETKSMIENYTWKENRDRYGYVSHKAQSLTGLCLLNPVTVVLKKIAWLNNLKEKKNKIIIQSCYDFFMSSIENSLMILTIKTLK